MAFVIGTNETIVPKYLLGDLHELKVEKGKFVPICVAGIVSQLCKSGADLAAFLLEDSTGIWRCEFFLDKCSFGDNFIEGMPVKIKGELRFNNYDEQVIRVQKISRLTLFRSNG
jgi:hypothetical protein